jgi:hypothetical protein
MDILGQETKGISAIQEAGEALARCGRASRPHARASVDAEK